MRASATTGIYLHDYLHFISSLSNCYYKLEYFIKECLLLEVAVASLRVVTDEATPRLAVADQKGYLSA